MGMKMSVTLDLHSIARIFRLFRAIFYRKPAKVFQFRHGFDLRNSRPGTSGFIQIPDKSTKMNQIGNKFVQFSFSVH